MERRYGSTLYYVKNEETQNCAQRNFQKIENLP
jgi:hypothetical protein